MSISSILQDTLDLIGQENDTEQPKGRTGQGAAGNSGNKTAASLLLEERRAVKRRIEEMNQTDFRSMVGAEAFKKSSSSAPLVEQLTAQPLFAIGKSKKSKFNTNHVNMPQGNKKKKAVKARGQDYQSRLQMKVKVKINKMKLKNQLKA